MWISFKKQGIYQVNWFFAKYLPSRLCGFTYQSDRLV